MSQGRKWVPLNPQEFLSAYLSGQSAVSLGKEYGVDPSTIREALRRLGVDQNLPTTLAAKTATVVLSATPCVQCGKRIPLLAEEYGDRFCSRKCAETHYGTLEQNHHSGREIFGAIAKDDPHA